MTDDAAGTADADHAIRAQIEKALDEIETAKKEKKDKKKEKTTNRRTERRTTC